MSAVRVRRKTKTPARKKSIQKKSDTGKSGKRNVADSYNKFKDYEGRFYTGMQVGRSHKWYYDKGEWKETKITPDLWQLHYAVTKRRAGKAPEGSGVPVGSGYHWFIVAHQVVKKLNSDDYTTVMTGLKYKLSHKNVSKDTWSNSSSIQRKQLIEFLKSFLAQIQQKPLMFEVTSKEKPLQVEAMPVMEACNGMCNQYEITINNEPAGIIRKLKSGWKLEGNTDSKLLKAIGGILDQQ